MHLCTKRTIDFLNCIARHLSSRSDCKGVTYVVDIGESYVKFSPHIQVYPDVHHRKECHKSSVVTHVLRYHFQDVLTEDTSTAEKGIICPNKLVSGRYEYRCSIDMKRRRWERVK